MDLVENFDEIVDNFRRFQIENQEIQRRLSLFRHWYYFQDTDKLTPSKFLGYKGNNVNMYSSNYNKSMDGRETVPHLKRWFIEIESTSTKYKDLYNKLRNQLEPFEKTPNKLTKIYILRH